MSFSHELKKNTHRVAELLENSQVLFDSKCFEVSEHSNDIKMAFFNPELIQKWSSQYFLCM